VLKSWWSWEALSRNGRRSEPVPKPCPRRPSAGNAHRQARSSAAWLRTEQIKHILSKKGVCCYENQNQHDHLVRRGVIWSGSWASPRYLWVWVHFPGHKSGCQTVRLPGRPNGNQFTKLPGFLLWKTLPRTPGIVWICILAPKRCLIHLSLTFTPVPFTVCWSL